MYSDITRRPVVAKYSSAAAMIAAMPMRRFVGTISLRSASLGACSDTAR